MTSNRMVVCWKCSFGEIKTNRLAGFATITCLKTGQEILDFKNPPKTCPVRQAWERDDADAKEVKAIFGADTL